MISKNIDINGTSYRVTLTDQVISHVNNLKALYAKAYEDPESFEQVSSDISSTITEISSAVEPEFSSGDLDGLIQEIIKISDNRAEEIQNEMAGHKAGSKPRKSRTKK